MPVSPEERPEPAKPRNPPFSSSFPRARRSVRGDPDDGFVSERVLDSTDDRLSLLLVVAVRVLRDPILALDAAAEAMAAAGRAREAGSVDALEHLGRVIDDALREERVPTIERRRNREVVVARLGPEVKAELHALGSARLDLEEQVMSVARRLECEAPTLERLARVAASGLVVGVEAEVRDRDGA